MTTLSPIIIAAVALGGAAGALSRFAISQFIASRSDSLLPWGTLLVNLLGAFFIGVLFVFVTERIVLSDVWRAALMAGFLGSLTTFSTFSLELFELLTAGHWLMAAIYMLVSVLSCLLLVAAGVYLARLL